MGRKETTDRLAARYGITVAELGRECMEFLLSEGYDASGREYPTLNSWLRRRASKPLVEATNEEA